MINEGIVSCTTRTAQRLCVLTLALATLLLNLLAQEQMPVMALLPGGTFEMGDHHGFDDPKHGSDELPVHKVYLDSFQIGIYDVTTREYCTFLNSALARKQIEVRKGGVYLTLGNDLLCDTRESYPPSRIGWDGAKFSVLDQKENHPMVCVRWHGAAAYCNWLSVEKELPACYNATTWECNFNKSGFRLPTEAEWEYAARGGQQNPYYNYPWGDDADTNKANVPESRNPFRAIATPASADTGGRRESGPRDEARRMGPQSRTTPVGFFNGKLQRKSEHNWPGSQETYQTANNANGYGLYDMAGNVWQWCTEWYERNYYAYAPATNPPGPAAGTPMPNGQPYRCMRGGSWFNGEFGHSRVSNRDPSYFRGSDPVTGLGDPDGSYFHVGFRVVLPVNAESRPPVQPTPVQRVARNDSGPGGGRPPGEASRPPTGAQKGKRGPSSGGPQANANPPRDDRGNSPAGDRPPRDANFRAGERRAQAPVEIADMSRKPLASFALRSPVVTDGGAYPKEFTGDGDGVTPPLEWEGAPAETKSFALILHHTNRGQTMSYWVLYNLPASVRSLPRAVKGVGALGLSSRGNHAGYSPPHSAGPGARTYVFTLYALSEPPPLALPASGVTSEVLLAAMKDKILASADLSVIYTRYTQADSNPQANQNQPGPEAGQTQRRPNDSRPDNRPAGSPDGSGGQRPVMPIVQALDVNGDGIIDVEEMAKAAELLKKLDKNGDGKLTPEEYRPQRPDGGGGQGGPGTGGRGGSGRESRPQRPGSDK